MAARRPGILGLIGTSGVPARMLLLALLLQILLPGVAIPAARAALADFDAATAVICTAHGLAPLGVDDDAPHPLGASDAAGLHCAFCLPLPFLASVPAGTVPPPSPTAVAATPPGLMTPPPESRALLTPPPRGPPASV